MPEYQFNLNSNNNNNNNHNKNIKKIKSLSPRFVSNNNNDPPDHLLNFGYFHDLFLTNNNSITYTNDSEELSRAIRQLMQIRCYSEHMVIYLHRSSLAKIGVYDEAQVIHHTVIE